MKLSAYGIVLALAINISPGKATAGTPEVPSNALRHEHVLLEKSLDDLERYLEISGRTARDPVKASHADVGISTLRRAMLGHGLDWRDSRHSRAGERWLLAYLVNSDARAGIVSVETRARIAWNVEKIIAADPAFASGTRRGDISGESKRQIRTWIAMGKRFAARFETYYPRPRPSGG